MDAAEPPPAGVVKHRIFLVEDHPITSQGIAVLINRESDLEVCGESDSGPKALDLLQKVRADLAVVDISLRTTSGLELTKNLKAILPKLPVLIMSMHDEKIYAERVLRAGAKGYIMKEEACENILAAIRRVLDGELYLSEKVKEKLLHRLAGNRKDEVVFSIDTLSDRELEVFQHIGNGYSTRQIAEKLNLSIKTIDSYREHLKLKLHIEKGTDLVRYAIEWGKSENIA